MSYFRKYTLGLSCKSSAHYTCMSVQFEFCLDAVGCTTGRVFSYKKSSLSNCEKFIDGQPALRDNFIIVSAVEVKYFEV